MKASILPRIVLMLVLAGGVTRADVQSSADTSAPTTVPPVVVTGTNTFLESQPFGPYGQPEWTAARRFSTTRVYVRPAWQAATEIGFNTTYARGDRPSTKFTQEFEVGLPYRLQVDYEAAQTTTTVDSRYDSSSFEVRWALADWNKIPLNPTLKAEWKIADSEADFYEFSISFGGDLGQRWHWGAELFNEQQVGDGREHEYTGSLALSYSVVDEVFGVGLEAQLKDENDKDQNNPELMLIIGPSIQWRPTLNTHLNIAPLIGVTGRAPNLETFIFFGFDFGPGAERPETLQPASLRNK